MGPSHRAIKPGALTTVFEFRDLQSRHDSLASQKIVKTTETRAIEIGEYTVGMECELRKDNNGVINATFIPFLRGSKVGSDLDWLSAKKLTLILMHRYRQENDIKLPIVLTDDGCVVVKEVKPSDWIEGLRSEPVSWYEMESKGLMLHDTLYVTLELV